MTVPHRSALLSALLRCHVTDNRVTLDETSLDIGLDAVMPALTTGPLAADEVLVFNGTQARLMMVLSAQVIVVRTIWHRALTSNCRLRQLSSPRMWLQLIRVGRSR